MTTSDDELLQSVADLYSALDPAPGDLADGVLARIAVQDLEAELLRVSRPGLPHPTEP